MEQYPLDEAARMALIHKHLQGKIPPFNSRPIMGNREDYINKIDEIKEKGDKNDMK